MLYGQEYVWLWKYVRTFGQKPFEPRFGQEALSPVFVSQYSLNLPRSVVIALNVRRNQPQCSNGAFTVRASKNLRGSCRSRGGRCRGMNGNSSYLFSTEKYTVSITYSHVWKWCRTFSTLFLTRMFDTRLAYAQLASNLQGNYQSVHTQSSCDVMCMQSRSLSSPLLCVPSDALSGPDCSSKRPTSSPVTRSSDTIPAQFWPVAQCLTHTPD